jgi:hypothetical protein
MNSFVNALLCYKIKIINFFLLIVLSVSCFGVAEVQIITSDNDTIDCYLTTSDLIPRMIRDNPTGIVTGTDILPMLKENKYTKLHKFTKHCYKERIGSVLQKGDFTEIDLNKEEYKSVIFIDHPFSLGHDYHLLSESDFELVNHKGIRSSVSVFNYESEGSKYYLNYSNDIYSFSTLVLCIFEKDIFFGHNNYPEIPHVEATYRSQSYLIPEILIFEGDSVEGLHRFIHNTELQIRQLTGSGHSNKELMAEIIVIKKNLLKDLKFTYSLYKYEINKSTENSEIDRLKKNMLSDLNRLKVKYDKIWEKKLTELQHLKDEIHYILIYSDNY